MSKPRNERKIEKKHFRDIAAVIGEFYPDYVVIVRTTRNGIEWKASNRYWAVGAADNFLNTQRSYGGNDHDSAER